MGRPCGVGRLGRQRIVHPIHPSLFLASLSGHAKAADHGKQPDSRVRQKRLNLDLFTNPCGTAGSYSYDNSGLDGGDAST